MRRDAWNARTWILAVVAGWSLLVAVLAMFGLGGRITPLPADPDLVQPLPRLPAAPPERLGPLPHRLNTNSHEEYYIAYQILVHLQQKVLVELDVSNPL